MRSLGDALKMKASQRLKEAHACQGMTAGHTLFCNVEGQNAAVWKATGASILFSVCAGKVSTPQPFGPNTCVTAVSTHPFTPKHKPQIDP